MNTIGSDFEMIYDSDFNYDMSSMDSIEHPYNADRISKIYDTGICSKNIFYDVPFEKKYLDFIKNAKYVTFDLKIHPDAEFYTYLNSCAHYHVGFDFRNSIKVKEINLCDSIKSVLIGDYSSRILIKSNALEYMYIGDWETNGLNSKELLTNIPKSVKTLMTNGYCNDPIYNQLEVLILCGISSKTTIPIKNDGGGCPECNHCKKLKSLPGEYYPNTLKELIIVPETSLKCKDKFVVNIPSQYSNIAKIFVPSGYKYECKIKWC